MIRTVLAQSPDEIVSLASLWQRLERLPGLTLFQSYRWNLAAASVLHSAAPYVVAVETSNGAAIIPAAVDRVTDTLTLLGGSLFDYRDVLSDDEEALAAAWSLLAETGKPLLMTALRSGSPHDCWRSADLQDFARAPGVSLDDISAAEFSRIHTRSMRLVRRLERAGAQLLHADGLNSALVRWIYEQKAEQLMGDPHNVFADRENVECMVSIAASEAERCDVYCYQDGSRIISALVTFRDEHVQGKIPARPMRRFYTIFFDRTWAHFSPGIALLYEVARQSLAEGLDCDFMTGEQKHKTRLATRSVPLYRVIADPADLAACLASRPVQIAA